MDSWWIPAESFATTHLLLEGDSAVYWFDYASGDVNVLNEQKNISQEEWNSQVLIGNNTGYFNCKS